jgi:hypothetical protein
LFLPERKRAENRLAKDFVLIIDSRGGWQLARLDLAAGLPFPERATIYWPCRAHQQEINCKARAIVV